VNIKGYKYTKTSRFLLELSKNRLLQSFIVIFTITGIALGYGFGFLSENLSSSSDRNAELNLKGSKTSQISNSNKRNLNRTIVQKQFQKNIITSSNLPTTLVKKRNTKQNKDVIRKSINIKNIDKEKSAKVIEKSQAPEKRIDELATSLSLKDSANSKIKIAIVFDDLGIDLSRSSRAIKLKSPLTLSFITYAPKLKSQTNKALDAGHELWMHMPMEPQSQNIDPGPNVLLTGLPKEELQAAIRWNLEQFNDYVGINNHMGSRFTSDLDSVRIFMKELKKRNLMFLDSRTSSQSVAQSAAIEAKVPFIARNIFIDHHDQTREIKKSLAQVERLAERNGYAVAIGHPRDKTLKEVESWLNTFEKKGLQLVPLSKLINRP